MECIENNEGGSVSDMHLSALLFSPPVVVAFIVGVRLTLIDEGTFTKNSSILMVGSRVMIGMAILQNLANEIEQI